MKVRAVPSLLPLLAIVVFSASAHAQRSRHERVEVLPIKKGGEIVGMKLKMVLRPHGNGHSVVRVGLGPNTNKNTEMSENSKSRLGAADIKLGYLLHQWEEIKLKGDGKPHPVELKVMFKDNPKIQPGSKVEIISAWGGANSGGSRQANSGWWHVWGLTAWGGAAGDLKTIPGTAPAQKRVGMKKRMKRAMPVAAKTRTVSQRSASTKAARAKATKPKRRTSRARR